MASRRVLVSWIGHADLGGMCQDLGPAERTKLSELVQLPERPTRGPGPFKAALELGKFAEIHLLSNYAKPVGRAYARWLNTPIKLHEVEALDPTDYGQVFAVADGVVGRLFPSVAKSRAELCFLLSPGTPTMAAIWVLLGKSRYPATFLQVVGRELRTAEIPFDLVDDFVPALLRDADLNLQRMAVRAPSEVAGFEQIVGESQALAVCVRRAQRSAVRDVPVLLTGESGTGKEMFARAIHAASPRRGGPFEAINCAAVPQALLESELFGYEKGAFTGAERSRKGAFARADGGTLFLDEIGECDPAMQAKLLRVMQPPPGRGPCYREFSPVGASSPATSNVRMVAATNKDLAAEARANRFREDLYYRLNVITVRLPPLRDRRRDIPALAECFLQKINADFRGQEPGYRDKRLSTAALGFVKQYEWPGNVRQLHNALLQAAVMAESEVIDRPDVAAAVSDATPRRAGDLLERPLGDGFSLKKHLDDVHRHYLKRALAEAGGNKTKAAALLGMEHYQTLDAQLRRLGT